jgi:hypothetical protein
MESIFGTLLFIPMAIIWLIPLLAISLSSRSSGGEKIAWLLAVIFVSWFAWIFYMLLAPLNERRNRV